MTGKGELPMNFDHLLGVPEVQGDDLHQDVTAQARSLMGLGDQIMSATLNYGPSGWHYSILGDPTARVSPDELQWWEVDEAPLGKDLNQKIGYGDAFREYLRTLCIIANRKRGMEDTHGL